MSDMGRAMASITADSLGWHDPLGLLLDTPHDAKYGEHGYQQYRNGMYRSGRDGLLIEIGKYGLTRRDLIAPVNLFSKVSVDAEGRFAFHCPTTQGRRPRRPAPGHGRDRRLLHRAAPARPGAGLRPRSKVGITAWRSGPAAAGRLLPRFRPECARALHNTDMLYLA
jgi:hypothetical protein